MSDKKIRAIQKKAVSTITKFLRGVVKEAKCVVLNKKRKNRRGKKSRRPRRNGRVSRKSTKRKVKRRGRKSRSR